MDRYASLLAAVVALVSSRACAVPAEDGSLPMIDDAEIGEAVRVAGVCETAVSRVLTAGLPTIEQGQ